MVLACHVGPGRRRARLDDRARRCAAPARRAGLRVLGERAVRGAAGVRLPAGAGPARPGRRGAGGARAAGHARHRQRGPARARWPTGWQSARRRARRRPPPEQHAATARAPGRHRRRGDRRSVVVGLLDRLGLPLDAETRRAAVHRPGHRHRLVQARRDLAGGARARRPAARRPGSGTTSSAGRSTTPSRSATCSCSATSAPARCSSRTRRAASAWPGRSSRPRTSKRHGLGLADVEGVIDVLRTAQEAEVALVDQVRPGRRPVQGRRRAPRAPSTSAQVCTALGGGGHRFAAGFTSRHDAPRHRRGRAATRWPGRRTCRV